MINTIIHKPIIENDKEKFRQLAEWCDETGVYYIADDNPAYYYVKEVVIDKNQKTQNRIYGLKQQLFDTDYQAIKYAEGEMSDVEYAPIKQQRVAWRAEINELEKELSK